jgi:GTP-binding protein
VAVKEPLVAIVGAPNAGKSRLFNRLTGGASIVHDQPGVTRDRLLGSCEWAGRRFQLMDTGGWIPGDSDEVASGVGSQVQRGVEQASLLLFLVDGRRGLMPLDQRLAELLRRSGRPILLAVNKVDVEGQEGRLADFFSLGFSEPLAISAEEGRGIGALLDRVLELLGEDEAPAASPGGAEAVGLALVGRPNVGKSTLFNLLVGEERALVSPVPGTTRDPVDAEFSHSGRRYRVVDTAGLRRKGRAEGETVEAQSIQRAMETMKRSELVIALIDALEPATHQDLAVIGACQKMRRPLVVAVNKIDLLRGSPETRRRLEDDVRERLRFTSESPIVLLSALHREGHRRLLEVLERMASETCRRIPTSSLNRALEAALSSRTPSGKRKIPRLYYITQTGASPPSFVVFTNGARIDSTYRRFLEQHLRRSLGFEHVPLSLRFRKKAGQSP